VKRIMEFGPLDTWFWKYVDKSEVHGGCWIWTRSTCKGYGQLRAKGRAQYTHRVAYELTHKVKLDPTQICCHACDVALCCNPAHLFIGTQQDNMRDFGRKERSPHISISREQAEKIVSLAMEGNTSSEISRITGVKRTTVVNIRARTAWLHVWEELEKKARLL
jgi:HNH endonuclease